jgi:hypothetical protein
LYQFAEGGFAAEFDYRAAGSTTRCRAWPTGVVTGDALSGCGALTTGVMTTGVMTTGVMTGGGGALNSGTLTG